MLPGQIKRNKFVVLRDGRKMFIDDVDYKGNNNPFGHWAIHVVPARGSTNGEWVTAEQVVRVVADPIPRVNVIDMGPLAYNRPTKQKTMNEKKVKRISLTEAKKLIRAIFEAEEPRKWIYQKGTDWEIWGMVLGSQIGGGDKALVVQVTQGRKSGAKITSTKNWYPPAKEVPEGQVPQEIRQKIWDRKLDLTTSFKNETALDPQSRSKTPPKMVTCRACKGTGVSFNKECAFCNGMGSHVELRKDISEGWTQQEKDIDSFLEKNGVSEDSIGELWNLVERYGLDGLNKWLEKTRIHNPPFAAELRKKLWHRGFDETKTLKLRGRWMPTKISKPPKKGKGASYNRQDFKKDTKVEGKRK